MKKLLVILMLCVMPLQASWALVAAYCQHEEDVTSQHFGHHDHEYDHEHASDSKESKKSTSGVVQVDLHDCHGHIAGVLMAPFDIPLIFLSEAPPIFDTSLNAPGIAALPERPQWLLAA